MGKTQKHEPNGLEKKEPGEEPLQALVEQQLADVALTRSVVSIELNLAKFASFIFAPSHTKREARARGKTWVATDRATGKKMLAQIVVETVGHETLTTFDHRTWLALQRLWWDRPRDEASGETRLLLRDVARTMRIGWGRKTFGLLKASLRRLRKIPITWRCSFFDRALGRMVSLEEPLNILAKLRIRQLLRPAPAEGQEILTVEERVGGDRRADPATGSGAFRFNEYIERNLLAGYTKPIFFDVAMELRGEIALGLYSFLDVVMADKFAWERRSLELFRDDLMIQGEYPYPSWRRKYLLRAVEELQGRPISTGKLKLAVVRTADRLDYKLTVKKAPLTRRLRGPQGDPKEQYLIGEILALTGDEHSRNYYRKVVRELPEARVWGLISETKQAALEGRIDTTKAKFFTDAAEAALGHRPGRG